MFVAALEGCPIFGEGFEHC